MGKKMTNRYKNMLKIALLGVALTAASGCTLDTAAFMDDYPPGLTKAVGNAGGDHDNGYRGGNLPGGDGPRGGVDTTGGGGVGTTDNGPGNSDFGRGSHPNAGGGDGSEMDGGNEVDPGNSGNSRGNSMNNDL
jgi:hypothetical protein